MTWTTDNRWSPGSSGAEVPNTAPAAYSARWIDNGDWVPADIVPDRQGFAYNNAADRERLIDRLKASDSTARTPGAMPRDETCSVIVSDIDFHQDWQMRQRRAGGYIYVDAWLVP